MQPDTHALKKKGNEQQFSFNRKVAKTSRAALKAFSWRADTSKAKEEPNKGISLIYTRQKIIKLAGKSEFGWATVQECVFDELAEDEADASNVFLDLPQLNKFAVKRSVRYEDYRTVLSSLLGQLSGLTV